MPRVPGRDVSYDELARQLMERKVTHDDAMAVALKAGDVNEVGRLIRQQGEYLRSVPVA